MIRQKSITLTTVLSKPIQKEPGETIQIITTKILLMKASDISRPLNTNARSRRQMAREAVYLKTGRKKCGGQSQSWSQRSSIIYSTTH